MRLCVLVGLMVTALAALATIAVVMGMALTGAIGGKDGADGSCSNRCGDNDADNVCQCDDDCSQHGDCCQDYSPVCFTCTNRCTYPALPGAPCQCNSECQSVGDCCGDWLEVCEGDGPINSNVTNTDLTSLTEELYRLDGNNMARYITIDMQGLTSSSAIDDKAPKPLYTSVSAEAFAATTIDLFEALRDNYHREVSVPEDDTVQERAEVTAFLDAVIATPLMARLDQFMADNMLINGSLRATIEEIWFTLYSRDGTVLGSSGFEHVFIGEIMKGSVTGFHNWISFYREEQDSNINYEGFIEYADMGAAGYVLTDRFTWFGANKAIGGGLVGTSPEYELAVSTLCFFARPNMKCPVQTNGVVFTIQTYDYNGKPLVGSAYPIVGE